MIAIQHSPKSRPEKLVTSCPSTLLIFTHDVRGNFCHAVLVDVEKLKQSKIILSCQPFPWEGDWRLGEALAAGALVFQNHMVDPYPGIINGENVILYNTTAQMLTLLRWYLDHAAEADLIAQRGRALAATWTPESTVSSMIRLLEWPTTRIRVFQFPFIDACINEEYEMMHQGLNESHLVSVVNTLHEAELLIIDLQRLSDCGDLFKKDPTVKERAANAIKEARLAGIKTMALDFNDKPHALFAGTHDYYFKRSRADRGKQTMIEYPRPDVHPIYYPVKEEWRKGLEQQPPRSARHFDVSFFFPLWRLGS